MTKRKIFRSIIKSAYNTVNEFVHKNIINGTKVVIFILPYLMYLIGQQVSDDRGYTYIGVEVVIPVIIFVVCGFFNSYADRAGYGRSLPVMDKRFTTVDEYGEVSIAKEDLSEVIIYLSALEDWLEKKELLQVDNNQNKIN